MAPKRQVKFQEKQNENDALLIVLRDKGMIGSGCGVRISIDNEVASTLKSAEELEMWVSPQEHLLFEESVGCLDSGKAHYELNLKPKQRKLMRVTMPRGFQSILD